MAGGAAGPQRDGILRRARDPEYRRYLLLLVLPGIWVGVVLLLEVLTPSSIQLAPLLAAAPAIACAGTGRRQCVVLAGLCAFSALLPWGPGASAGPGLGQRIGTFGAILVVAGASYVISVRRLRSVRQLEDVQAIAEAAQRVLLRQPPSEIADVLVAVRYASATAGASVGGDFYEVVDTPYGVRAVIGDVRGSGLSAVGCAAVLLGSFREAAYDEPDLRDLVHRLDVSLRRHLGDDTPGPLMVDSRLWEATDVLTAPVTVSTDVREEFASVVVVSIRPDGMAEAVNCGHPAPYVVRSGVVTAFDSGSTHLPLGLGTLARAGGDRPRLAVTPFDSGDSLLLFTNGVTKVRAGEQPYPLADTLADLADANPDYVLSAIHTEVTAHALGPRADDLAMLYLHKP